MLLLALQPPQLHDVAVAAEALTSCCMPGAVNGWHARRHALLGTLCAAKQLS